jgi:hypothetical protein
LGQPGATGLPRAPDRAALAQFIVRTPLSPPAPGTASARLPVLARKVHYKEVKERVFNKVCWNCHSDADYAIGDGGPGQYGRPPVFAHIRSHLECKYLLSDT